jgi:hypothetical protein
VDGSRSSVGQQRGVASVLVIAADPNIELLVGELVAFAGHRPIHDVTAGAAGESVRRIRPDVTLLDTSLPTPVVRACLDAVAEVGSQVVLMSSTASASELVEDARTRECLYFPLPGGPKPLARILERAIALKPAREPVAMPRDRSSTRPAGSVHPALCAALASVSRARALGHNTDATVLPGRPLGQEQRGLIEESRRSQAALRAAVTDYTKQLKANDLAVGDVLTIVQDVIAECATVMGAEAAMPTLLLELETWTRAAYFAV